MTSKRGFRILIGITKSNFGGAQRYVFDLAHSLKEKGHNVQVLCGGGGGLIQKLQQENIPVITHESLTRDISFLEDIKAFAFILDTLYIERPHIFHVNSSKMGILGALAGRVMGTPRIIFTAHGWAFNESRPHYQKLIIKLIYWITILLSHHTICVSEKTRADISSLPFIKKKLSVIHNGIKTFPLLSQKEARKKLDNINSPFVAGTIAELHPIKGLDVLLEAWAEFTHQQTGHLVLVGEGSERDSLENKVASLGISSFVSFAGFKEDARALLQGFDVFVLPSRSEGLPYALLEAGQAGLPVVATNVGGISEVIENNASGLLVPSENKKALCEALLSLAKDKPQRITFGTALKEKIERTFSLEKMVHDTLKIYE